MGLDWVLYIVIKFVYICDVLNKTLWKLIMTDKDKEILKLLKQTNKTWFLRSSKKAIIIDEKEK